MSFRLFYLSAAFLWMANLASCVSTTPTAEQLDAYQKEARAELRAEYDALEEARGQMTPERYAMERAALDLKVQEKADNKAWGRHALAESEMRANGIPTPDQPVDLRAPGTGSLPNSIYNTPRNNPMTGQQQNYLGTGGQY